MKSCPPQFIASVVSKTIEKEVCFEDSSYIELHALSAAAVEEDVRHQY